MMGLILAFSVLLSFATVSHQSPLSFGNGHESFGALPSDRRFDNDLQKAIMWRLLNGKAVKVELETDRRLTYEQDKECSTCGGPRPTIAPPANNTQLCLQTLGPAEPGCWYNGLGNLNPLTCPITCVQDPLPSSTTINPIDACLQAYGPPPASCWYTGGGNIALACGFQCTPGPF
ncbi:hypothetical protein RvY_04189 [Ramazzottius varieornatus]|uniref:ADAMTS cysteine-rich domain-containing protein n=1 Tax=Ramazzottius varieornatus TaxID=947166 RepID=A0A1D1V013_RAMVA|nr:hypothetical protein RvY_04189 [Ramazzottius varieornatus]